MVLPRIDSIVLSFWSQFRISQDAVSFRITDGGEVTLNVAQADKLDGRIDGAVLIVDSSSAIGSMLEKSIDDNVKDISTSDAKLSLSVDQFRNLPAYNNDDVVIQDTEANILKALTFDVLDDRVSLLNLITDVGADQTLTVTAAQAEKLGHYTVQFNSVAKGEIILNDRASAIASFIEDGVLPSGGLKLKFKANDGLKIQLNYKESEALKKLIIDEKVTVDGLTKNGNTISGDLKTNAVFGFDEKSLDDRLTLKLRSTQLMEL